MINSIETTGEKLEVSVSYIMLTPDEVYQQEKEKYLSQAEDRFKDGDGFWK